MLVPLFSVYSLTTPPSESDIPALGVWDVIISSSEALVKPLKPKSDNICFAVLIVLPFKSVL